MTNNAASYFSVVIPCASKPELATQWHPTAKYGPFATLTRGAFATEAEAHEWARTHIPGSDYTVRGFS